MPLASAASARPGGPEPALVTVPQGRFWMGSEYGQENERPVHHVWVDEFLMGACQVTNADYGEFLIATGTSPPPLWNDPNFSHPRQPVTAVSWFDAMQYCEWLRSATGRRYRLPTETEWERAARGGADNKVFPWGDDPPQLLPNYEARWQNGPEPVAQYPANPFGLFDICENVHEWCNDWYAADYYSVSPECNPRGPDRGERRVSRGGSWRHHVRVSRCAARSSIPPEFRYADYGFRVACEL